MNIEKDTAPAIAVVGIAAQLPSGKYSEENLDYHSFWKFLHQKRDAYETIPQERLDVPTQEIPNGSGTFLKNTTKFDNVEFGISNKDAKSMVATTRRLIELAFLAMLDSGIDSRGKRIGSFMTGTAGENFGTDTANGRGVGTAVNTLANRVSYTLDLSGPSLYLDTACSSSLTALHLALRSIENGDCDAAIIGSCHHNMNLFDWIGYTDAGILSPGLKCKPFDSRADGFAKGEGAVVFVVKPLEAAIADNDHIYSVILGSAINSNGASAPLHAPSGLGQQDCIRRAWARASKNPTDVDFVELHATGTSVGDPIEANAAGQIFGRDDDIVVGSLKGNLGHLETCAFSASLAKACLILENQVIPPNANLESPNTKILWDTYRLKAPTSPMPLKCRSSTGRPLIGVSSSGIGGSNGHVVLEGSPPLPFDGSRFDSSTPVLFVVGGLSPRAAGDISASLLRLLLADASKEALSQAVLHARRARQLPWRTYFTFTPESSDPTVIGNPVLSPKQPVPVVYVFAGQGPQHIGMGRDLFQTYPVFRDTIIQLDQVYKNAVGVSLLESTGLFDGEVTNLLPPVWSSDVTIPAMTMVQIALYELLKSVGLAPNVLVGHSAGETAMLYASGAGTKEMAMEIAIARAKAMKLTEPLEAGMAAFACDAERAQSFIDRLVVEGEKGILEIACYNGPGAIVLSGSRHLVNDAVKLAQSEGLFARSILTLNPSHSSLMEACREEYLRGMEDIFSRYSGPHKPTVTTYSSVSGEAKLVEEFTPGYFWNNVRRPVRFHETITSIFEDLTTTAAFVEISPHPVLSSYVTAVDPAAVPVCPMRRPSKNLSGPKGELVPFAEAVGRIITLGVNSIDLTPLYGRAMRSEIYDIPYPFTDRRFPLRVEAPRENNGSGTGTCSLRQQMNAKTHPDLAQHVINREPIVPATAFIDMVLQTGARTLWDIEFAAIISLASEVPTEVRVENEGIKWKLKTKAQHSDQDTTHAHGCSSANVTDRPVSLNIDSIRQRLPSLDTGFYETIMPMVEFGPLFRLKSLAGGPDEFIVEVPIRPKEAGTKKYVFDPVILDTCIHAAAFHPDLIQNPDSTVLFLPSRMRKFVLFAQPSSEDTVVFSHVILRKWTPETRVFDCLICDKNGSVLCGFYDIELQKGVTAETGHVPTSYDLVYQPVLIDTPLPKLEPHWAETHEEGIQILSTIIERSTLDIVPEAYPTDRAKSLQRQILLPPSTVEWARSKWPTYFEITEWLAKAYQAKLQNTATPTLPDDVVMQFNGLPFVGSIRDRLIQAFDDLIRTISSNGKRVLRVLEVGAGSGFLTNCICEYLEAKHDLVVEYVISDISSSAASSVANSVSYKHVSAKAFDISQSLEEQEIKPGTFDIVTGLHFLQRSSDASSTLSSLRRLLLPGGSLLMVEFDRRSWQEKPGAIWLDLVSKTIADSLDLPHDRHHADVTPEQWESSLLKAGYSLAQTSVDADQGLEFVLIAQNPSTGDHTPAESDKADDVFFHYKFGQEMDLQRNIASLDVNKFYRLWLIAENGRDADAGAGLAWCLVRELSTWEIHLAIFDSPGAEKDRIETMLRFRKHFTDEPIVRFTTDGRPLVPKVMPSPVAGRVEFNSTDVWISRGNDIVQSHLEPLKAREVSVEISSWSSQVSSHRGFVGTVIESKDWNFRPRQTVIGVVESQPSNYIVCHSGQLAIVPTNVEKNQLSGYAMAMVISVIALGHSRFTDQNGRRPSLRIMVADEGSLGRALFNLLTVHPSVSHVQVGNISDKHKSDLIIVDSTALHAHPELESYSGTLFVWDTVLRDSVKKDPWSVGDALELALPAVDTIKRLPKCDWSSPHDLLSTAASTIVPANLPLFKATKCYILIGGASELGVHIALWMYKRGARYIVLTSRRGREFLDACDAIPTKQALAYLDNCEDLVFRVEGCDATSTEDTLSLVQSIEVPLGGCFLMTLVLSDGFFMKQTEESLRKVCDAKLKSAEVFSSVHPIKNLDFFVSFSSMIAIMGNAGQSNYAMANAAVEGFLTQYPNAYSLSVPGISRVGVLARAGKGSRERDRLDSSSITPDALCVCIEDGLSRLLWGGKCNLYVPDLPWNTVEEDFGVSRCARHLLTHRAEEDQKTSSSDLLNTILKLLDLSAEDFSPEVPFTAYGLDSLGATRLSELLQPFASVSQMQLLGGLTWEELEARMSTSEE